MRNQSPKNVILSLSKNSQPLMRYKDGANFEKWQASAREKLHELLGLDLIADCDDDLKIINITDCEDYTDTYFSFQSESGYYVPCHFLKPKNTKEKMPVILCLQGHSTGMHISIGVAKFDSDEEDIYSGDRDYARIAVRRGYCALAIEQRYMGECGGSAKGTGCLHRPKEGINALPALLYGRTAIGERVHDTMRSIDVISNPAYDLFDCIDADDIVLTGNSGGGTTTFYTACIDERIKYAVPSCSVCTFKDSIVNMNHCACNYIPSIARYFDMGDLAGLIVPRGLIVVAGREDKIFPIGGVKATLEISKPLFAKANAEEKIDLVIGDEGHRYYAAQAFAALEKMRKSSGTY